MKMNEKTYPGVRLVSMLLVFALAAGSMFWRVSYTGLAYSDSETYCGYTQHQHSEACYEVGLICGREECEEVVGHTHSEACYETVEYLVCGQEESAGHEHTDACYEVIPASLICGQEESDGHTHSEACYTVTPSMLICGEEEDAGHVHTEECYALSDPILICDLEEDEEHSHTEDCYYQEEQLICGEEERTGHVHTADCYSEEVITLTCGLQESEGHTHTESCYSEEERILVCGQEEYQGHSHSDSCYETEQVLVCGLEERESAEGHTHTDACYAVTDKLICSLPEHVHTEACLSNPYADLETAGIWESTLPARSGVWADDVLAIARSQIGYTESSLNFEMSGTSRKGYTRYGAWYGIPYGDWCAMFASFCLYYAGVPTSVFPEEASVSAWRGKLSSMGLYAGAGSYTPKGGDLVFFNEHVGIVEGVSGSVLYTIEGNTSNAVREKTYSISDGRIVGYGILPGGENASASSAGEEVQVQESDQTEADKEELEEETAGEDEEEDTDESEEKKREDEESEEDEDIEEEEEEEGLPEFDDLSGALFGTKEWRYDLHVHRYVEWMM